MKSFTESQFAYCPLVWMWCDKTSDYRINYLHKRVFRTVYNDNVSAFEKYIEKDNYVTIHLRNLRIKENRASSIIMKFLNRGTV